MNNHTSLPLNNVALLLRTYGAFRATTKQYRELMLSEYVDSFGNFLVIYKAHAIKFPVKGKKIGPGVYTLTLVGFDEKIAEIDKKLSSVLQIADNISKMMT